MAKEELISFALKWTDERLRYYSGRGMVKKSQEADLRQDVILYVLNKIPEYNPNLGITEQMFVKTVIKNKFRDFFSQRKYLKNEEWRDIDTLPEADEPVSGSNSQMSELDHIYLKLDLETIRKRLSPELQEVFDLLGTHSPATIASMLNLTAMGVEKRIDRIKKAIKKYFPDYS